MTESTKALHNENGTIPQVKDNRLRLDVDPKEVEMWEIEVVQQHLITPMLFLFSCYLADGNGRYSPAIPKKPYDEMSSKEIATIKGSSAYKKLRHFGMAQLKVVAESFAQQALDEIDPN